MSRVTSPPLVTANYTKGVLARIEKIAEQREGLQKGALNFNENLLIKKTSKDMSRHTMNFRASDQFPVLITCQEIIHLDVDI